MADEITIQDVVQELATRLSWENVALQLALIAAAMFFGWVVGRAVNKRVEAIPEPDEKRRYVRHLRKLFVEFVENTSFSFLSGSLLALGCYFMVMSLEYAADTLILCRVAYNVLFAFALLSLILSFIQEIMGEKLISPGMRRAVVILFWILVVLQFFGVLGEIISIMESTKIPFGGENVTVWTCFVAVLTVLLTLGVANWLSGLSDALIRSSTSLSPNLQLAVSRVVRIVLFVVAVIIGLSSVGIDLTVLSVFGGALGVGLGFGLQKIASNYISGFIILLDRSVKIGDMVEVAGFKGRVTQINTRFTVVRNNDGVENIVPNETFVTSAVLNHSFTEEASVQYISISVAYGADVKRALAIMLEEGMRERPRIVKGRKGWSYLDSFGDSGINLKLGFWVKDPVNGVAGLKTEIATTILERFNAEGIEVPFNQLEINIRKADVGEIPVKVVKQA